MLNSPDKFLERTQNICLHCGIKILLLGGSWWHRNATISRYCDTKKLIADSKAEPKFEEGSEEHLKAIHT